MSTEKKKVPPVTELYEQAMKNYEEALKTGLKLQEESGKYWTSLVNQKVSPDEWQKQVKALSGDLIPQTQKSLEECLKLIEQGNRTGLELMKKAATAAQSKTIEEAQENLLSYYETSLNALRDTAKVATQANTQAIDSWMQFVRKVSDNLTSAAKAATGTAAAR